MFVRAVKEFQKNNNFKTIETGLHFKDNCPLAGNSFKAFPGYLPAMLLKKAG